MSLFKILLSVLLSLMAGAAEPGSYSLVNGTQGCPDSVEWRRACQGFILIPQHQGSPLPAEKFCHINTGPQTAVSDERQTIVRETRYHDGRFRKTERQSLKSKRTQVVLNYEDSIIPDHRQGFLWDHSRNQQGFSCLYRK